MMYVLTQLVPRAKTTDTSIIAVSDTKEKLENYFKEIVQKAREKHDEDDYLDFFSGTFSILEAPYIE